MKFAIVVSEFNQMITGPMLESCLKGFSDQGFEVEVFKVPGAAEIPLATQRVIEKREPDAVVALGCIIEGETDHYKAVCEMTANGIMEVSLKFDTPVIFEVLMVDTYQKAEARIDKGYEASKVAVYMAKGL